MESEKFVTSIKEHVRDASITDTLEFIKKPPGRKPRKRHVEMSNWFNSLSDDDRHMVSKMMEEAVDSAIFGFFGVIDGVRAIEDTEEKTKFELYGVRNGCRTKINEDNSEFLHDIYNALTNPTD